MSAFTPTGGAGVSPGGGGTGNVLSSTTPLIDNVTVALANTEQSYMLPVATKRLAVKCRTPASLKIAFIAGQSGTTYVTLPPSAEYTETELSTTALTLYYQSPTAGVVVEILTWT